MRFLGLKAGGMTRYWSSSKQEGQEGATVHWGDQPYRFFQRKERLVLEAMVVNESACRDWRSFGLAASGRADTCLPSSRVFDQVNIFC